MAMAGGEPTLMPVSAMCTPAFVARVVRSRWFVVFASMVVMAASGSTYIFALYSKELRSTLGYNQQTLNTLSFFKDLGTNVGVVSGLVQQVAPTWAVLLIGAAMNLAGYLMVYLALDRRTAAPPVWLMCVYICVGANALTFSNTGALVSCVKNFPPPSIAVEHPTPTKEADGEPATSCVGRMFRPPELGEDYSIMQALVSVEMAVLFVVSVFGIGGTLTAIDNMAQIGQSLGYPAKSINTFVSLISIWNYAGRVGAGYLSEMLLARYRFPRPLALTAVLLASCVGHLLIAFGVPGSLYAASVIIGFCFGAQWPLLFAIISEVFGLKYYSTLFNFGSAASPIGAYVLNVRVAGRMYDAEAARQHGGVAVAGDKICKGVMCFKRSFLIITGVTFAGALVSLLLVWRTRSFYKGDIYARFKVAPATAATSAAAAAEASSPEVEEKKGTEKNKKDGVHEHVSN
ncbi:Os12g0484600 [Oryza sativa Japonica Group]|uniref:Os12g0484600 protein n=1 Tax=Oryza sativa subsp. japonica TaxID=39947 RepID=A0A0P0YA88_ORYSJ|nr:Os12g0484600 [Oryza sativa Japonica Group]